MTDPKLNICFVALYAFPLLADDKYTELIGGAELQMVVVARHLAARGHKVSMVCLNFGQRDQIEIDGIRVFRAFEPNEGIPILRFFSPRLTSIWRCLKAADADIYYQQTAGMLTGVVAHFCKTHAKKSVFASASNPDLEINTSRVPNFRDKWIYSYGLRNVDLIFVQNDEQAQLCRHHYRRRCDIVRNCYDVPVTEGAKTEGSYVLWVATIRTLKRPEIFLDMVDALPQLKFKMVGGPDSGNRSLFEAIRARAEKLPNLDFLGFIPFKDVERVFDNAMIVVNTSDSEGVPNALIQAWARGIPTVSFTDPGAEENGTPICRIVDDTQAMITSVREFAEDLNLRHIVGLRSKNYIEKFHSSAVVIPEYERLFRELCLGACR